ncbi:hypothetical protein [Streptomyces lichenis]|nr:hypothetical protein [Streptomyces lichenis]
MSDPLGSDRRRATCRTSDRTAIVAAATADDGAVSAVLAARRKA